MYDQLDSFVPCPLYIPADFKTVHLPNSSCANFLLITELRRLILITNAAEHGFICKSRMNVVLIYYIKYRILRKKIWETFLNHMLSRRFESLLYTFCVTLIALVTDYTDDTKRLIQAKVACAYDATGCEIGGSSSTQRLKYKSCTIYYF